VTPVAIKVRVHDTIRHVPNKAAAFSTVHLRVVSVEIGYRAYLGMFSPQDDDEPVELPGNDEPVELPGNDELEGGEGGEDDGPAGDDESAADYEETPDSGPSIGLSDGLEMSVSNHLCRPQHTHQTGHP
jgi:hypothetical protein